MTLCPYMRRESYNLKVFYMPWHFPKTFHFHELWCKMSEKDARELTLKPHNHSLFFKSQQGNTQMRWVCVQYLRYGSSCPFRGRVITNQYKVLLSSKWQCLPSIGGWEWKWYAMAWAVTRSQQQQVYNHERMWTKVFWFDFSFNYEKT